MRRIIILGSCLAAAFQAYNAQANWTTWDPQGSNTQNPYLGSMTGTWEAAKWSTQSSGVTQGGDNTGTSSLVNWVESTAAIFGTHVGKSGSNVTPAYTVTMNSNHTVAGFFIGPENPNSCTVTINGTGVITLASGDQGFYIIQASDGSAGNLTISNVIAGTSLIAAECGNNVPGQIYFNGTNTWSGGLTLGYAPSTNKWTGIINFNNSKSFGTGNITLQPVGNGSAFVVEGTSAITIANNFTVAGSTTNNIVGNPAGVTFSGTLPLGANTVYLGSGAATGNLVTLSGVISGTGNLGKLSQSPSGTLELTGVDTYSGSTTILSGTLKIGGAGQLGSGSYAGAIANSAAFLYNSSAPQTLSGVISGTGSLTESGSGVLKLSGANTYTGVTIITASTLQLGANNSVPSGSYVQVANGATFDMNGFSDSVSTLCGPLGATLPAGNVVNNNGTLTLTGTSALNTGEAGNGAYSGVISGSGNVVISGGGSTTFSGLNTYGGTTTVNGGTLVPSYNGTLPAGSALTVNTPGVFDIVNVNETIPSLAGSGTVNLESGTLTVGGGNTPTTFAGVIQNAAVAYNNAASVNGLQGFYYPTITFSGTPVSRLDSTVDFTDLTQASQNPLYPTTNEVSIRWLGQVLTTGTGGSYTFTTTSDDGSRCWVNGVLVVDNWTFQGATSRSGSINLSANTKYDIRVEYMQGTGGASCVLSWTPPGGSSAVIPNSNLFTYAGAGGLVKTGTSTFFLNGANTYAGNTAINSGTLALGGTGSINNTANISIAAGATYDVSSVGFYNLSGSTTLSASGTGTTVGSTAATINSAGTVNLASQPIYLTYTPTSFTGDSTHMPLYVPDTTSTLQLNGNTIVVSNATATPLGPGTYTLIQVGDGLGDGLGTIGGAPSTTAIVSGAGLAPGTTATLVVSGSDVNMVVSAGGTPTTTTLSVPAINYGQTSAITASVSPIPASGGTVQFFLNGSPLGSAVALSSGTAGINLSGANYVAGGSYSITAIYSGSPDNAYQASSASAKSMVVNQAPVTITANNDSKTYGQTKTYAAGSTAYTITSGSLAFGESIGSVTLACAGGPPASPVSGSPYTITPSLATGGSGTEGNYNFTYAAGALTVNKAVATITASNQPKVYGTALTFGPGSTKFSSTTLSNSETIGTVTLTCSGGPANSPVSGSPYVIAPSVATGGSGTEANYNITYVNATTGLTVTPLPVVLSGSRMFDGTTNAAAAILSVANKVSGDVVNLASGNAGLAGSAIGTQAITSFASLVLGGAAAGNYTLTGASGSVTITPVVFSITSEAVDSTATHFTLTWQSTSGVTYHVIGGSAGTPKSTWTTIPGTTVTASSSSTSVTFAISLPSEDFAVVSP